MSWEYIIRVTVFCPIRSPVICEPLENCWKTNTYIVPAGYNINLTKAEVETEVQNDCATDESKHRDTGDMILYMFGGNVVQKPSKTSRITGAFNMKYQ